MSPGSKVFEMPLIPFAPDDSIEARVVVSLTSERWVFRFVLKGEVDSIEIPPSQGKNPVTGLWENTCFECFAQNKSGEYWEWNWAPAGDWNSFFFSEYRKSSDKEWGFTPQVVDFKKAAGEITLTSEVLWKESSLPWVKLGVSMVLNQKKSLSYWALKHTGEKPDFHHSDSFVIEV